MGIPDWAWPDPDDLPDEVAEPLAGTALEDASELFGVLSNEIRLDILATLYQRQAPISYSDLRAEAPVDDNGKLNYHLRELDPLVDGADGEYALTAPGRETLRMLVEETDLLTASQAESSET